MRIPETVNLHIYPHCNQACRYCYGTFPEVSAVLSGTVWCSVIDHLASVGVRRLTFSGGEPTLHRDLGLMLVHAREAGLQTAIITNGAQLNGSLMEHLDLVGLSIDSADERTQAALGRSLPRGSYIHHIIDLARLARAAGALLKLNTVVTRLNMNDDLNDLVTEIRPDKWKPMQFVHVRGENDASAADLAVTPTEFETFVARHARVREAAVWVAAESAATIRATYVMVDPSGRLFQHAPLGHVRSRPVLDVGLPGALEEVGGYDRAAFLQRGGQVDLQTLRNGPGGGE